VSFEVEVVGARGGGEGNLCVSCGFCVLWIEWLWFAGKEEREQEVEEGEQQQQEQEEENAVVRMWR